jgi:CO/xanthine dehydrogenase FAD-binding subunit
VIFLDQLLETELDTVFQPKTLREAARLIRSYGSRCRIIAGGTDLMVDFKGRGLPCKYLVSMDRIQDKLLNSITLRGRRLTIGSVVTMRMIEKSPLILKKVPILAEMARSFGSFQIRNMATVGGNICRASPAADSAPPLLALDAKVHILTPKGRKTVPLNRFFRGPGNNVLKHGDLALAVTTVLPKKYGGSFVKHFPRSPHDIATVSVAAVIERDRPRESVKRALVALGAVGPTPMLAAEAGKFLEGRRWTDEVVEKAAELTTKASKPITDVRASREYRLRIVNLLARRALRAAWDRS